MRKRPANASRAQSTPCTAYIPYARISFRAPAFWGAHLSGHDGLYQLCPDQTPYQHCRNEKHQPYDRIGSQKFQNKAPMAVDKIEHPADGLEYLEFCAGI